MCNLLGKEKLFFVCFIPVPCETIGAKGFSSRSLTFFILFVINVVTASFMENPVINLTISGVGWWTSEETVRRAVSAWGEVKELKEVRINESGKSKASKG